MNTTSKACATLIATLYVAAAHAGVRIESVTRNTQTGAEQYSQIMLVQDGKARIDATGGRTSASIFKNDALHILDAQRQTYMVMDKAAIERTANSMNQMLEQMRVQMAAMPPEQRATMEQMMKQNGMGTDAPATIDVKPVGGNGSYQGKSCKLWTVTRNGEPTQQLCVMPFNSLAGADEMRKLAENMRAFLKGVSGPITQMIESSALQSPDIANKLGGFPVISRQYKNGTLSPEETVVKSWQSQSIDAAQFEIPAGYAQQQLPSMPATR